MATLWCSLKVHPEFVARWEAIARAFVRESASDVGKLRYEYYRAAEPNKYYILLAFEDTDSFYEHQGAEYHEHYFREAGEFITDLTFEWLDPLPGGGSGLPLTSGAPISASASERARAAVADYPIEIHPWWDGPRRRDAGEAE